MEIWIVFALVIIGAFTLDLGVFSRIPQKSLRQPLLFSLFWISLAAGFDGYIWLTYGTKLAVTFTTAYVVELSLSADNLFVFLLLFNYFEVPKASQHKALFWGILGAVILRALFIGAGIALIHHFDWLLYVMGAFLIFIGLRTMFSKDEKIQPEQNPVLRFLKKFFPVTTDYRGQNFFVRENGRLWLTPLFVVVVLIETSDIVFAIDSIPAVLAISLNTVIVFTSNIFAVLGLRSLFFLLSGIMPLFRFLPLGISAVLTFVGLKMLLSNYVHLSEVLTLSLTVSFIGGSVILSLITKKNASNDCEN